MAAVLFGGSDIANEINYGSASRGLMDSLSAMTQQASRYLTDTGRRFVDSTREFQRRRSGSEVRQMAEAVKQRLSHFWQDDNIRFLESVPDVQNAPRRMMRWIMANPEIRRRHRDGLLDAYGDKYTDPDPTTFDENHEDYQRMMNGVWLEEGGYREYHLEFDPDEDLTLLQRMAVFEAWDISNNAFDQKRDPTSVWDASL